MTKPRKTSVNARYALRSDNKSGFRGVSYDAKRKKYRTIAFHEGKQVNLGWYDKAEDAGVVASDFRLANYPPQPMPLCRRCKEDEAKFLSAELCNRCYHQDRRRKQAKEEGRALGPYKKRRSRTECGSLGSVKMLTYRHALPTRTR